MMEISDWQVVLIPYKGVWKCAIAGCGEQYAILVGQFLMHKWCAGNLDTPALVNDKVLPSNAPTVTDENRSECRTSFWAGVWSHFSS